MCLWLITACLSLMPAGPSPGNVVVVQQPAPTPILQPTTAAATTTTKAPGNTSPPSPPPTTSTTTARPTTRPTSPPATNPPTTVTPPATNQPTTGNTGVIRICNNPFIVCVANPDQLVTGAPMIDPRVGTPPPNVQIQAYQAQITPLDSSVKFPRDKRSIADFAARYGNSKYHVRRKRQSCTCVPVGTCSTNNGAGMIDFRIVTPGGAICQPGMVYCCNGGSGTPINAMVPCGTRQIIPTSTFVAAGQADFGEYPWMVMILTNQNEYVAGGVLIDQYNVLTVIHRINSYIVSGTTPNLKVRLGEWDAASTSEPYPFQEYTLRRVFTHPSYNAASLEYDIAVLRLSSPVPISPNAGSVPTINRACLPTSSSVTYAGQRCWVSGWGRTAFGGQGQYQQILKKVDVPIVDPNTCQNSLRAARLGANYQLNTATFTCAGGEANKDSCTGDGGSGLVCEINGQWTVVGLVSWGLGCASPNVPGVYTNVAALLPWVQQQIATQ